MAPSASPAVIWRNANTGEIAAWFMSAFIWSSALHLAILERCDVYAVLATSRETGKQDLLLFDTSSNVVGYWQSNGAQPPSLVPWPRYQAPGFLLERRTSMVPATRKSFGANTSTGALGAWQVNGSSWSDLYRFRSRLARHGNFSRRGSLPEIVVFGGGHVDRKKPNAYALAI